jgi:VanZ family protein
MSRFSRAWQRPMGLWLDVVPAILYLGVLFWFGLTPLERLPGPDFALADKVWHAAAFGGLGLLLTRVALFLRRPFAAAALWGALGATLLGGALEVLQSFTRYRSADLADFVADALGAWLVYLVLRWLPKAASAESG